MSRKVTVNVRASRGSRGKRRLEATPDGQQDPLFAPADVLAVAVLDGLLGQR